MDKMIHRGTELSRRFTLLCIAAALGTGLLAWISGPPGFDFLDGTEFAVCGARLEVTHPPGYPLFVSTLRVASVLLPGGRLDYGFFRIVTSLAAGAGFLASVAVMTGFGAGPVAALLGTVLLFTFGPVMGQLNVLEIHGFSLLLVLVALLVRRSRCGPYLFSLSMFGGHPLTLLLLPAVWTRRFRERWLLLAVIPASIWLFVPIRSMLPALSHYSRPSTAPLFMSYVTMYGEKITHLSSRAFLAAVTGIGTIPLIVLLFFIAASGRMRWRLLASSAAAVLYLSVYSVGDIYSMLWIPLLPLGIWASGGICRLLRGSSVMRITAVLLVTVSVFTGIGLWWRADDRSGPMLSGDMIRGVGLEGVYISTGFITFHSVYLFEMEDRRPDILPMDTYQCFYMIPPPQVFPDELVGRSVYATRAWGAEDIRLHGLLFSASTVPVDWGVYDVFDYDGGALDWYARDDIAEAWVRRAVQESDEGERMRCENIAEQWSTTMISHRKLQAIQNIFEGVGDEETR